MKKTYIFIFNSPNGLNWDSVHSTSKEQAMMDWEFHITMDDPDYKGKPPEILLCLEIDGEHEIF